MVERVTTKAKMGGIPVPFELFANAVGGQGLVTVRVMGQEFRLALDPSDVRAIADMFDDVARRAAHGKA